MNLKKAVLLLLCVFSFAVFSQESDSLKALLKTNLADTIRVQVLNKLVRNNIISNPNAAYDFGIKAVELSEKIKDEKCRAMSYLNMGRAYYFLSKHEKALEFSFKALTEYEKLNDKKGIATAANNVGGVYYVQKNYSTAMEFYQRSLKLRKELNDKVSMAALLGNIGGIYYEQKNYDEALKYYYTALENLKGDTSNLYTLSNNYGSIANVYWYKHNFKKALEFHLKALSLQKQLNDMNGLSLTLANIGGMYNDLNKPDSAIKYLTEAIIIARGQNNKTALIIAHTFMSTSYEIKGDYKKANELHKLHAVLKDSMYNSETTAKMAEVLSQYETDKKDKERSLIEKAKEAEQNAKLEKQKLLTIAVSVVAILILILLIFIYRSFKEKQKTNAIIIKQKKIVDEKQKEILDSIQYAKKIQTALMTSEKYMQKNINRLANKK